MPIKVKFFASLRELAGQSELKVEIDGVHSVADVLKATTGELGTAESVLCAVNFETVSLDHPVADGDEVAFFPPVTGG
ncbi:MAG: MoaD/ThiS family protein [Granulosicoccaceae bacterium]